MNLDDFPADRILDVRVAAALGWANLHVRIVPGYGGASDQLMPFGLPPGGDRVEPVRWYSTDIAEVWPLLKVVADWASKEKKKLFWDNVEAFAVGAWPAAMAELSPSDLANSFVWVVHHGWGKP